MATELKIPVPDQTTEEVRIVQWKKNEGDTVKREEIILEVESDKSVIEVESVADGVLLKQLFPVDEMVPVGEVVAYIGQAGEKLDIPDTAASKAAAAAPEVKKEASASAPSTTSTAADGAKEIKIPIPDQTTEEVRIVKWRKAEGEAITKDEIVLEVETDKSVIEVEAIADGVLLKQLFTVDDMVPVGKVVGFIGAPGTKIDDIPAEQPAAATKAPAPESTTQPSTNERIKASPVAKKVADKLGVNLSQVTGTGPQGRITREDVEKFAQAAPAATSAPAAPVRAAGGRIFASPNAKRIAGELKVDLSQVPGSGPDGRILGKDVQQYAASKPASAAAETAATTAPVVMEPVNGQPRPGTVVALTKMRRAIGMNLQMSSRDTPHFNCTVSIDMTRAMEIRKQLNGARAIDKRISVNDMIVRACAVALKQYPAVNCRLKGDELHYLADVNIGVATAVPDGLVVPLLTNAETRDWDDLAAQTKRLATEARKGKILGAGKGTFTVSNLGMFGVEHFTAIINPPESAILAVGGAKQEVVAIAGGIGIRPIMRVTLCSDHRLIDGALAAQFLQAVKKYLEEQVS